MYEKVSVRGGAEKVSDLTVSLSFCFLGNNVVVDTIDSPLLNFSRKDPLIRLLQGLNF